MQQRSIGEGSKPLPPALFSSPASKGSTSDTDAPTLSDRIDLQPGNAPASVLSSLGATLMAKSTTAELTAQPSTRDLATGLRQVEESLPGAAQKEREGDHVSTRSRREKLKVEAEPAGEERREDDAGKPRDRIEQSEKKSPLQSREEMLLARQEASLRRAAKAEVQAQTARAAQAAGPAQLEKSLPTTLSRDYNLALKDMLGSSSAAPLKNLMGNVSFLAVPESDRVKLFGRIADNWIHSPGLAFIEASTMGSIGQALDSSLLSNGDKTLAFLVSVSIRKSDLPNLIQATEKNLLSSKDSNNKTFLENLAALSNGTLVEDLDGSKVESHDMAGRILKDVQLSRRASLGEHNPGLSLEGLSPSEYSRVRMEMATLGRSKLPSGEEVKNRPKDWKA